MATAAHSVLRRPAPAQSAAADAAYKSALSSIAEAAEDERREVWADGGRKAVGIRYRRICAEGGYRAERWARLYQ